MPNKPVLSNAPRIEIPNQSNNFFIDSAYLAEYLNQPKRRFNERVLHFRSHPNTPASLRSTIIDDGDKVYIGECWL